MSDNPNWASFKTEVRAWSLRQKLRSPLAGLRGPCRTNSGRLMLLCRHWPHLLCWSWLVAWEPRRVEGAPLCLRFGKAPAGKTFDIGPIVIRWQRYDWIPAVGPNWRPSAWAFIEKRQMEPLNG